MNEFEAAQLKAYLTRIDIQAFEDLQEARSSFFAHPTRLQAERAVIACAHYETVQKIIHDIWMLFQPSVL